MKELASLGKISVKDIATQGQLADALTKSLGKTKLLKFVNEMTHDPTHI